MCRRHRVARRRTGGQRQSAVRVNEQMKIELGREPTVSELAERLGVAPEDVTEAMEMGPAQTPVSGAVDDSIGTGIDAYGYANLPLRTGAHRFVVQGGLGQS